MLVLTRKAGETVVISDGDEEIEIRILKVQGKSISIGVNAPPNKRIYRGELVSSDKQRSGSQQKGSSHHDAEEDAEHEEPTPAGVH